MQVIEIKKQNAFSAWNGADKAGKKLLEDLLGKENISGKITDLVKTFEDACAIDGKDASTVLPFTNPSSKDEQTANAIIKLLIIARSLNGKWVADYNNTSQKKWYPYFQWDQSVSAFRFWNADYECTFAYTDTGARLSFETEELAKYAGSQFIDIYNCIINH